MTQPIFESHEFYYLTLQLNDHKFREFENPLGRGLKIVELPQENNWGYATWLDLFSGQVRTLSIDKKPQFDKEKKDIHVISTENKIDYHFRQVDKSIYNAHLRKKLRGPLVHNEEELSNYLKSLNPFE